MSKGKVFTAQEVQAIIAGNKKMFREICKRQPYEQTKPYLIEKMVGGFSGRTAIAYPFGEPAYQKGQKIFCKESFVDFRNNNSDIFYKSDFEINNLIETADINWKPASQMKQEHSRLTLQIKEIRVERLADISEEDAIAEGVVYPNTPVCCYRYQAYCCGNYEAEDASWEFKQIWNATHKKPEEKFEANPWVWSIRFEVVK